MATIKSREELYSDFGLAPSTLRPPEPEPEEFRDWTDEEIATLFPDQLPARQKRRTEWLAYFEKVSAPVRKAVLEEFGDMPPAVHHLASQKIGEMAQRHPEHYFGPDGSMNTEHAREMALSCYADACREQKVQLLDDYLDERRELSRGRRVR